MSDFYLVNINRREFILVWNFDIGKALKDLLNTGWSLDHVINIDFSETREDWIKRGFTALNG
jgi:hypothetical protein